MNTAMSHVSQSQFTVATRGRGTYDITREIGQAVRGSGMQTGIVHVFTHHTSCSLIITENADPTVRADLERYFARLVADGDPLFRHTEEGEDDMSAHVRAVLTATSLSLPVTGSRLALGTWQGVYLWEHRARAHQREVTLTIMGA